MYEAGCFSEHAGFAAAGLPIDNQRLSTVVLQVFPYAVYCLLTPPEDLTASLAHAQVLDHLNHEVVAHLYTYLGLLKMSKNVTIYKYTSLHSIFNGSPNNIYIQK